MESNIKQIFLVPEFIAAQGRDCIHYWKQWKAMAYRIDNHVHRIYVAAHPVSGEIKEFDCKGPGALTVKLARNWGATVEDQENIRECCQELQLLKSEKGKLNAKWTKLVYGKSRQGNQTLLQLRSAEVIDLYGKYYSLEEIRSIIQNKWQFSIRPAELQDFYNKHKDKIDRLRADYVLAGKEIRLATDAGRMEVLSKIAFEMEKKFEVSKTIDVSRELRAVIEQIRKEVKGEELRLTVDGKIDITATIQANQTVHEALQKLPINMIVIGLTAAKQGINPAWLIGSLANSYYAKFNGFNKLADRGEIQLPGAYIKAYNWDEIKMKQENKIEEGEAIEVYEENIAPLDKTIVIDAKQRMLDILKGLKEDID